MRLIDRLHLEYPSADSRMLRDLLRLRDIEVGRRRVRTLMRRADHGGRRALPGHARRRAVALPGARDRQHRSGRPVHSRAFTDALKDNDILIWMDGKGYWRDNVFVERLWKSVKYKEVYLIACDAVSDCRASLDRNFGFYSAARPHSRVDRATPNQFYFETTGSVCYSTRGDGAVSP